MNKQKILQISIGAVAVCGAVATLGPQIQVLPPQWQPYGIIIISVAVAVEKVLIATNQVLVGPTKMQSASTQTMLSALPDKAESSTQVSQPTQQTEPK